ncbi:MAG: MFS transporter [Candidatus Auribacterota bacterium]|nr:MFS transporter [Candidatus Auribacterota bacterium]
MTTKTRKAIFGWALYDWANSAFATTVMAGFFPLFFKNYWSAGTDTAVSTARLGLANSIAGIVLALMAPLLGAIADRGSARKRFLIFFAYLGVIMTVLLSLVARGNWPLAVLLYILSVIGFSGSNIFYDALLPAVARKSKLDTVSALGYGLGYLGGGLLFALNIWMMLAPGTFGFADQTAAIRFSFLTVGIWWALFTIPLLCFVRESRKPESAAGWAAVREGLGQLRETFREIRQLKTVFLFLVAYWLYIDGVDTIVRMAVDYGSSLGFEPEALIKALLLTQFIGFPAAIAFGYLGRRIGARGGILIALAGYILITIWGTFLRSSFEFYILAAAIGLVQGGIQALSRSYYTRLIPPGRSAEFFGFYNMIGKFAAVLGPLAVGGVTLMTRSLGAGSTIAARAGIASIVIFFLTGGAIFLAGKPVVRTGKFNN